MAATAVAAPTTVDRSVSSSASRARIESVDLVRGIVMILMAIDHTRDFFTNVTTDPTNPATTTVALFLTRFVTHICAPTFFLLTGVGAFLTGRKRTTASLSRLLITRGIWMIVAELTVMRIGYQLNFDYRVTGLIVLWALGWSMICLGLLVWLPRWTIAAFGLVLVFGHNALDGVRSANPLWVILHGPGLVWRGGDRTVFALYPLIPWLGVTAIGYVLGEVWNWTAAKRNDLLLRVGTASIAAFLVLRLANVYGDPVRWTQRPTATMTVLSFLNVTKYPVSLLFLLLTLGTALLMLRWADRGTPRWLEPAVVYGRVPFLYYSAHFALIHVLAALFVLVRYGSAHWMVESPDLANYPFTRPPGWGYGLPVVYALWILVVVAMYPLCRWFARVKAERRSAWLSYL